MTTRLNTLLLTTALSLPMAGAAFAQTAETACDELAALLDAELSENLRPIESDLRQVADNADGEVCVVRLVEVRETMMAETDGAVATDSEEAVLADTASTTLTLQDEVVVEGRVFLDTKPPAVDVTTGATQVDVQPGTPSVTVTERDANIVVRQAAAEVTIDMPVPTVTIMQPAPEIIITMPDPDVAVANAQPRVEVRQADPIINVTQSPPAVQLELQRAAEGAESAGIRVNDRRTGTDYAAGEAVEPIATEDATVSVNTSEAMVKLIEDTSATADVTINRNQPTISFEQAEPKVSFASSGEPTVTFQRSGEPIVTFRENDDAMAPTDDEASMETDAGDETEMAAATPVLDLEVDPGVDNDMAEINEAIEADAETDMGETDMGETDAAPESDMVEADATSAEPMFERDGYTTMTRDEIEFETLQGMVVYSENDENIGEIGDLVITTDGAVELMIVEVGGFLGMGEKPVALPVDKFSMLRSDETGVMRLYVEATEEELEAMETYQD